MNNSTFLIKTVRACLVACSFFSLCPNAYSANELIIGFNMISCRKTLCTSLKVKKSAERGVIAPIYAFSEAQLIQKNSANSKTIILSGRDGYYDQLNEEIVLRKVHELNGQDTIVQLKTGEIKVFN